MVVIYRALNTINNKAYIGFDSHWPTRKREHLREAFKAHHNAYNTIFHNAIRKYGTKAFIWEIIYQSMDKAHTLNIMEPLFIKEHNSYYLTGLGYNMTLGGGGTLGSPRPHNKTPEARERSSKLGKLRKGLPNGGKGIPKSLEHKANMSRAHLARAQSKRASLFHTVPQGLLLGEHPNIYILPGIDSSRPA